MDKQVEMLIIGVVGAIALLGLYEGQFTIVTTVVAGLIGYLSHGIISSTDTAVAPVVAPESDDVTEP